MRTAEAQKTDSCNATSGAPLVSVIVPTYQEAQNLPYLANSLSNALSEANISYELILVDDDSGDDTPRVCQTLAANYPVQLITRRGERGLSSAVLRGFVQAKGQYLVVMDADLSHPASAIPQMIARLQDGKADFVSGSRLVKGASVHANWSWFRRLNSYLPTWMSRPLSPLRDPMSGFFAFRRDRLPDATELSPVGYKIGLEILVKGKFERPSEVAIHFAERQFGKSKLTFAQQLRFLQHLRRLYHYRFPVLSEFVQFGMVGASGFVIDLLFYLGLQLLGLHHTSARAVSFVFAASWNWFWNRTITYYGDGHVSKLIQWPAFLMTATIGFCINWGSYTLLTQQVTFFDQHRILALIASVVAGMGANFFMARTYVFRPYGVQLAIREKQS